MKHIKLNQAGVAHWLVGVLVIAVVAVVGVKVWTGTHADAPTVVASKKSSVNVPLLGFYPPNGNPSAMPDKTLLGTTVPLGSMYLSSGNWGTLNGEYGLVSSLKTQYDAADNSLSGWSKSGYRMVIDVPMLAGSSTLAQCATGTVTDTSSTVSQSISTIYGDLASDMVSYGIKSPIIRLGSEFNGTWFGNEDAVNNPSAWTTCFQKESSAIKTADASAQIDFDPVAGAPAYVNGKAFDWKTVYPGNKYVDIIGLDLYDDSTSYPAGSNNTPASLANEQTAWSNYVNEEGGLQDQVTFAKNHSKPMSLPEWGLQTGASTGQDGADNPYFVQQVYNWVTSHNYEYVVYFDSTSGNDSSVLSNFPESQALFTKLFTPLASESPNK